MLHGSAYRTRYELSKFEWICSVAPIWSSSISQSLLQFQWEKQHCKMWVVPLETNLCLMIGNFWQSVCEMLTQFRVEKTCVASFLLAIAVGKQRLICFQISVDYELLSTPRHSIMSDKALKMLVWEMLVSCPQIIQLVSISPESCRSSSMSIQALVKYSTFYFYIFCPLHKNTYNMSWVMGSPRTSVGHNGGNSLHLPSGAKPRDE